MSEWVEKPLGELANLEIGGTPSRDIPAYWADANGDGHPWVSIADLRAGRVAETSERITDLGVRHSNVKPVKRGTVLMTFKLTIGEVALADCDLFTNEAIVALTPKLREITSGFLFHALPGATKSTVTDAAIKGATLNKDKLARIKIRFPVDLASQDSIARILRALDTQIEATEDLIAKQERVRAGLMQDLFTRGVDEHGQLRPPRDQAPHLYQQTELGWLPLGWETPILDRIANRVSGHTPNRLKPDYWNGGVKWVSLADSNKLDRPSISETTHEISHLGIQNSSAQLHPSGTVFVSRDAGVGKSSIMAEPMAVSQHFIAWVCDRKLNNLFLYYYLQANKRMFENIASGSTIVTIGLDFFKRMRIPYPCKIDEQEEIARALKAVDDRLDEEKAALAKLRLQKSGLMQDLLTGTVSVAPLLERAAA